MESNWNRGKQFDLAETLARNNQEVDVTHYDNETLLYMLEEAVLKAKILDELTELLFSEAKARGLIE